MDFVTVSPDIAEEFVDRWEIPADAHRKNVVIERIIEHLGQIRPLPPSELFRYRLCLDEAITNSITHGCPQGDEKVEVEFYCSAESFVLRVRDHGPGFCPEDLPDPEAPGSEFSEHGRGVVILDRFADSVIFAAGGRELMFRVSLKDSSA